MRRRSCDCSLYIGGDPLEKQIAMIFLPCDGGLGAEGFGSEVSAERFLYRRAVFSLAKYPDGDERWNEKWDCVSLV